MIKPPLNMKDRWALKYVNKYLQGERVGNPKETFHKILNQWRQFIEFTGPMVYLLQAIWGIGTYFYHLFNTFPYLQFNGPKRSGKTQSLMLHSCIAFNALLSSNMSASSLFRLVESTRGTLLIDENERLATLNPEKMLEIRSMLLSGYKKGSPVYRVEKNSKDQYTPEAFGVYNPKAIGNISGLEDVLEDRCIPTIMRRSINRAITDRIIDSEDTVFSEIRAECYVLFLQYWQEVLFEYRKFSEVSAVNVVSALLRDQGITENETKLLSSRELELWGPIFSIALFLDRYNVLDGEPADPSSEPSSLTALTAQTTPPPKSLFSEMVRLAAESANERVVENATETADSILCKALLQITGKGEDGFYKVSAIRDAMVSLYEEPQGWINSKWIGRAMKRLDFKDKRRVGAGVEYKLSKAETTELPERMGVADSEGSGSSIRLLPKAIPGICELCRESKDLTHSTLDAAGKKTLCCSSCAKDD